MASNENIFITPPSEASLFFADPALEAKTAGTCDLYMQLEKTSIQLALKERRSGNLIALEIIPASDNKQTSWKELLENTSAHSKLLRNYEFLKVTAGIMSQEFTLVPESLFKSGDENIYYHKNFPSDSGSVVRAQFVPSFHLYTIFSLEKELENELNHLFQDPQLWHYSQAFLASVSLKMKTDAGKQLWLNIRNNKIDIVVSENRSLLLMNSFSWQTNEDVLYFTLFVCEQLELNPDKFPMIVTGIIEVEFALFQLLNKYIRNISIAEQPSNLSLAFESDDLPFHRYAMLFNLALCE